jgi:hypothetical protein
MQPAAGKISYEILAKRILANVRYWHKADIQLSTANVRFREERTS